MTPADYGFDDDHDYGEWEPCHACGGEGSWHDCSEDTCCCLHPELDEQVLCDECGGAGGWYLS